MARINDDRLVLPFGGTLANEDLLPAKERNWKATDIFAMWMSAMHSLGNYTAAAALFIVGLNGWQVLLVWFIGFGLTMIFTNWMARIGQQLAVPFPVIARLSFGVLGANLPALVRAVIGIAWYGIQTYLASAALVILALAIDPSLAQYSHPGFLGLSTLGWIGFGVLWLAQLIILTRGIEAIRKFQHLCGPGIWVMMFVLAGILVAQSGWKIDLTMSAVDLGPGETVTLIVASIGSVLALNGAMMLNFADFSRFTPSYRDAKRGNFWGLPVNGGAFALIVVITTAASLTLYGEPITDPASLLVEVQHPVVLAVGAFCFLIATMGINIVGNVVPAAFDLANLAPKHINFRKGAAISCSIAVLVMPWKLYSSPIAITYFLGSVGALVGPLLGIMLVDYYFIKKQIVDPEALYSDSSRGAYAFRRGWNPTALKAFIPGALVAIILAVVPALSAISFLSWFLGTGLSAALYYGISRRAAAPMPTQGPTGTPARAAEPAE